MVTPNLATYSPFAPGSDDDTHFSHIGQSAQAMLEDLRRKVAHRVAFTMGAIVSRSRDLVAAENLQAEVGGTLTDEVVLVGRIGGDKLPMPAPSTIKVTRRSNLMQWGASLSTLSDDEIGSLRRRFPGPHAASVICGWTAEECAKLVVSGWQALTTRSLGHMMLGGMWIRIPELPEGVQEYLRHRLPG